MPFLMFIQIQSFHSRGLPSLSRPGRPSPRTKPGVAKRMPSQNNKELRKISPQFVSYTFTPEG